MRAPDDWHNYEEWAETPLGLNAIGEGFVYSLRILLWLWAWTEHTRAAR